MRTRAVRRSHRLGPFRVNFSAYRISSVTCWWGPGHRKVIYERRRARR